MPLQEEKQKNRYSEAFHNIVLENRERLSISGVTDVDSFDEKSVVLFTTHGLLTVNGYNLHINKLSIDNGEVFVEGDIWSVEYSDAETNKSGGFFSRLFK